ncbi:hypothetical protein [Streptomyces sp. IBSBF 3136]|uniref:hypothetical protein n=1 Tax=Streptomyces sp. IBSBF 3136 TaxID=2903524 RepID=UPI002FDC4448
MGVRHNNALAGEERGVAPLLWTHVNPYGRFELDMHSRLDLGSVAPIPTRRPGGQQPRTTG